MSLRIPIHETLWFILKGYLRRFSYMRLNCKLNCSLECMKISVCYCDSHWVSLWLLYSQHSIWSSQRIMPPSALSEWATWARCMPSDSVKLVGGNDCNSLAPSLSHDSRPPLKVSSLLSFFVSFFLSSNDDLSAFGSSMVWPSLPHHSGVGVGRSGRQWCKKLATLIFLCLKWDSHIFYFLSSTSY